jgi:hypothetical protein
LLATSLPVAYEMPAGAIRFQPVTLCGSET